MRTEPIHRMHLKGPWIYEWIDGPHGLAGAAEAGSEKESSEEESPLLADSRVRMPSSLQSAFGNVSGTIRLSRRFQRPTNLDDNERVHIAFDGIGGQAEVSVNGQNLGSLADTTETVSFDISPQLLPSNELSVELRYSPSENSETGGLHKPVAIEIHRVPNQ
ncbi:MAG: hypothetical protein HQ518_27390 [Rhodopirellula sp.]|nr:hypothetical protein [Rhodopirellula sp.]